MSKGLRVWATQGIKVFFVLIIGSVLVKYGLNKLVGSDYDEEKDRSIQITTVYSGEGILEVLQGDALLLSGNGSVSVKDDSCITVRLVCKDKNLISDYMVNGMKKEFAKGQYWVEEIQNISEDTTIEAGFKVCNTITIVNDERYQLEVDGAEFISKSEQENKDCYFYSSNVLNIKLILKEYWLVKRILIDGKDYVPNDLEFIKSSDYEYKLTIDSNMEFLSFKVEREKIPVIIKNAKGSFRINDVSISNGQMIDRCSEYKCSYTTSTENVIVDYLYINSNIVILITDDHKWEVYNFTLEDKENELVVHVFEHPCDRITSYRDFFKLKSQADYMYWPTKYNTIYMKQPNISLVCNDNSVIEKIQSENITQPNDNTLKISNPATLYKIAIRVDGRDLISSTPLHFLYDGDAPTITNYSVTTHPTTEGKLPPIDITVTARDTGVAGIDQIMCGTYEEYKQWVAKIASGEYESRHEKGDTESSFTYENQEDHIKDNYYVWTIDCAANISEAVKLDLKGPVLQCSTDKGWHNSEFQVTGEADEEIKDIFYSTSYSLFLKHTLKSQTENKTEDQQPGRSKSKAWSFTVSAKDNKTQTYYVWAYDQYGNKSATPYVYEAKIDVEPPELKLSRSCPEGQWSKDIITLTLGAEEKNALCNSGLEQVFYSTKPDGSNPISITYKNNDGEYVLQSPTDSNRQPVEMNQQYYFWAADKAGNLSAVQKTTIQIDCKDPILLVANISAKSENNQITSTPYGICSNGAVDILVTAKDEGVSSGLGKMYLYQDGKEIASTLGDEGKYRFNLDKPFFGEISFQVEDGVGHRSSRKTISQLNAGLRDSYLRLEDEVPQVQIDYPTADYTDGLGNKWFKQDVSFSITCQDKGSGVRNIRTWVNDQLQVMDHEGKRLPDSQAPGAASVYTISTSQARSLNDGSYRLRVQVTDYCGNVKEVEHVIYIDRVAPKIGQFTFTANNKSYHQTEMVKKESYGYYFEGRTLVRIQAMDQNASSGIQKISYYTIDYGRDQKGEKSEVKAVETDANGGIAIVLSQGFKGQIYARAQDQVGNYAGEYSIPYGVIIESVEANSNTANVGFLMPATEHADRSNRPLYGEAVELVFTAQDYFNGIAIVEWTVTSPQDKKNNQTGKIVVDGKGKLSGPVKEAEVTRDRNLVTSIKHGITARNNSNDIRVNVKITDRSGHSFMKSIGFSIDKTKPQISVVVPGQSKTGVNEYFNKGQVVKLQVKERNFDQKKVNAVIKNDLVGDCIISQWSEQINAADPDNTLYTATVSCEQDGAYSIKGEIEDRAGNMATMVEDEFVVDTTIPKVQLSFSGTSKNSDNHVFFQECQTVTVTIDEHNFDPSNLLIQCRRVPSLYNQTQVPCGQSSGVITNGDYHSATLELMEDGWYTIEVTCKDKAGNGLQQTLHTEFGIDTTKPSIIVEGVGEKSANNGELLPMITIQDDNYESNKVTVSLCGSKTGEVAFAIVNNGIKLVRGDNEIANLIKDGKVTIKSINSTQTGKGHELRMDCFPDMQSLDDLYTLTIEAEDTVGNKSSHSVEFSVNRYGSVYSFSSDLQKLAGSYVQSMGSVRFTETNVNSLVKEDTQIKLSRNGVVSDLVENKDYNVQQSGDSQKWNQYIYELDKRLFEEEGRYTITVHSKDASGNINENDLASKGAQIVFGVDKTNPIISASNIKENEAYDEASKQANISISDNIALSKVSIYLNDVAVDYKKDNDTYQFILPSSNQEQNVKIVAEDSAGNVTTKEISHIYVTTNLWVRFCHNKVLLVLTVSLGILILMGILYVFLYRRKRLEEKDICGGQV